MSKGGGFSLFGAGFSGGLSRLVSAHAAGSRPALATKAICRESKAAREVERHDAGRFGGIALTERATLAPERKDHIHASDCLPTSMSSIHDGVSDDVLEEDLQHTTLQGKEARDEPWI